ncbi:hypothetical protein [Streptomyces sp. V3I7]|uniref:hypothetical protein n=1 Tax=Streptomyces sp. V3I7 TaxID=3042278 RepID=UPI00278B114B|nr:hypothetical protein [Streptomyces sp. V3I7]MDQ0989087.1 hypothetical protein [Streptomyces sp. V3I7]
MKSLSLAPAYASTRHSRWRFAGLSVLLLACTTMCQHASGDGGSDDSPPPSSVQWSMVPRAQLPAAFLDFQPRQVLATQDEFVVSGLSESRGVTVYGSKDGSSWYRAQPKEGIPEYLAAREDRLTLAGTWSNGGNLVPAVWRTKDARHWKRPEILPGGVASDQVLAVSDGPEGTVVVTHDGGPFSESGTSTDASAYRGESLRLWTARPDGPFGQPRDVPCPAYPTHEPQVSAVADAAGFVVTAACTNESPYTKRLVVISRDGTHWSGGPTQFKQQTSVTSASGEQGSVLVTRTEGSQAGPDEFMSALWSRTKGADAWTRGRPLDVGRVPDTGVAPRDEQALNAVSVVPGGFVAAGHSRDLHLGPVGALWASPDGRQWTKQPTKRNHFDQVFDLYGAAGLHGRYILLGRGEPEKRENTRPGARLWLGRSGSPPTFQQEAGVASFARTWTWGHGSLTIDRKGHFTYRWRLFRYCGTDPAPCDTSTVWGGKATGTLSATGDTGTLRGRLDTTNTPKDRSYRKGATIEVKRMPYSAVSVRVDGKDHGFFCATGPEDSRCLAPDE